MSQDTLPKRGYRLSDQEAKELAIFHMDLFGDFSSGKIPHFVTEFPLDNANGERIMKHFLAQAGCGDVCITELPEVIPCGDAALQTSYYENAGCLTLQLTGVIGPDVSSSAAA